MPKNTHAPDSPSADENASQQWIQVTSKKTNLIKKKLGKKPLGKSPHQNSKPSDKTNPRSGLNMHKKILHYGNKSALTNIDADGHDKENSNPNRIVSTSNATLQSLDPFSANATYSEVTQVTPTKSPFNESTDSPTKYERENNIPPSVKSFSTPKRSKSIALSNREMTLMESPFKSPMPGDWKPHHERYTDQSQIGSYAKQNQFLLDEFRCKLCELTGGEVVNSHWFFAKNTAENPWSRFCVNTASNFCDRNTGEAYQRPEAFVCGLKQCCSLATRREGVSMVFLRHPRDEQRVGKKTRYAFYRTSEFGVKPLEFLSRVLSPDIDKICAKIEHVYATAPFDGPENKSLVLNIGFLTLQSHSDPAQYPVALITANGMYNNQEANNQMKKIEAVIQSEVPGCMVHIIPKEAMPRVKKTGTVEHCETVFSNLVRNVLYDTPCGFDAHLCTVISPPVHRSSRLDDLRPKELFPSSPLSTQKNQTIASDQCFATIREVPSDDGTDRENDSQDSDTESDAKSLPTQ